MASFPHQQHTNPEISSFFRAIAVEKTIRVFGHFYSVNLFSETVHYGSVDEIVQLRASPETQTFVLPIIIEPILFRK
jgi:hypothetical protein